MGIQPASSPREPETMVKRRRFTMPTWRQVTLVVYGWRESQPGTLSWVYPSVAAAVRGVHALRNAARWLIVAGPREGVTDVERLRRKGLVLLECCA